MPDGDLFAGRYRLRSNLGSGAMGEVWLADDTVLGRPVAIKQLRADPALGVDQEMIDRMVREARIAASLSHTNVVAVFDLIGIEGRPYVVMEYVPGEPLADRVRRTGRLGLEETAAVGSRIASALAAAHRVDIVHRDVKPANILIALDGTPKLADFGIARGLGDGMLTQSGMVVGTVAFMAPEIARGEKATPASDVWSLGATLFTCLRGAVPHDVGDRNTAGMLVRRATTAVSPIEGAGALGLLIDQMLASTPTDRPTATEASRLLAAFAGPDTSLSNVEASNPTITRSSLPTPGFDEPAPTITRSQPSTPSSWPAASSGASHPPSLPPSFPPSLPPWRPDGPSSPSGSFGGAPVAPPPVVPPPAVPPPRRRRTALIAAGVVLAVAAGAVAVLTLGGGDKEPDGGSSGGPTGVPGLGGQVLFETQRGDTERSIWQVTFGGSDERLVIAGAPPAADGHPTFSKSGLLAFLHRSSVDDSKWTLMTSGPDGTGARPVAENVGRNSRPAWSPDETQIVLPLAGEGGKPDLWIIDLVSGKRTQLTKTPEQEVDPEWSPDGTRIAFRRDVPPLGDAEIFVRELSTGQETRLTNHPGFDSDPRYSPDGKILLVTREFEGGNIEIATMSPTEGDKGPVVNLTNNPARDQDAVWHPTGNAVVWQSDRDAGDTEIYWMRPDGTQQTRLTFHPGFDGVPDVRGV